MNQDSNQTPTDPTSSSDEPDKLKIVFAPGCFDEFDGTQEELQELLAEIQRLVSTGEIFEQSVPVSDEEMDDILSAKQDRTRQ